MEGILVSFKKDKLKVYDFNFCLISDPSYNISPGEIAPIIVSAKHFDPKAKSTDRVLIPALWGLIPRWHTGDYKKHGLTTNNARLETLVTSKLYKPCLERSRRCIIPIEGFYEWSTVNPKQKSSERPAYYIYTPQLEGVKLEDKSTWNCDNIRLMFMAGLFDVWHDSNGESMQSFTIITFESDSKLSWLHHRTPAIFETEEQISNWLNPDYKEDALKLIQHPKDFVWHQVSNIVNNSRNKSPQCNKPYSETSKQSNLLTWMKRKSETSSDNGAPELKKTKSERDEATE